MTGHQNNPVSGRNFDQVTGKISIRSVLEGLGVGHITEIDTYQQSKLTELVKAAVAVEGFSVVIARHPCMLKFTRQQRRKAGYQLRQVDIDQQVCERIHTCVSDFACPTFTRLEGGRIEINADLCIGDGSCMQVCPAQAITAPKAIGQEKA